MLVALSTYLQVFTPHITTELGNVQNRFKRSVHSLAQAYVMGSVLCLKGHAGPNARNAVEHLFIVIADISIFVHILKSNWKRR